MSNKKFERNELLEKFLTANSNDSTKEIIFEMMDCKHNLPLKARIKNPEILSFLKFCSFFMNKTNFTLLSNLIDNLINTYLEYTIGKDGLARKEVFSTLSAINSEIKSLENINTKERLKQNFKI